MSLPEDVSGGSRRAALVAIRDRVAAELEEAAGRDVAALSRELRAALAELDSLPAERGESDVDQLAAKRSKRQRRAAG